MLSINSDLPVSYKFKKTGQFGDSPKGKINFKGCFFTALLVVITTVLLVGISIYFDI